MLNFLLIKLFLIGIFSSAKSYNGTSDPSILFRLVLRCPNLTNQTIDVTKLESLSVMPNKAVKILLHGYHDSRHSDYIVQMAIAYLKKDNFNIIIADYSTYFNGSYAYAANNTFSVGKKVGDLIMGMNKYSNVSLKHFHLIGASFGAHVAAVAGKYVKNNTGSLIGRISGLDPSGPIFQNYPSYRRLKIGDAKFVDVIYTDRGGWGINYLAGNANFFPNNGKRSQPYCRTLISYFTETSSKCSHRMAPKYFINSINSYEFNASQCNRHKLWNFNLSNYTSYKFGYCNDYPKALMGENCDLKARGNYFLTTNSNFPYARG